MRSSIVAALLVLAVSAPLRADEPKTSRSEYLKARAAAEANDPAAYLAHMRAAMELEHDRMNRPVYQYNLARAHALNGDVAESLAALEAAWNERIEGPMIVFADVDPAFAAVRSDARYARVRELFDTLRIDVARLGGSVYELTGAGCTIVASIGSDGVLLVDSGYPRTTRSLLAAMKREAKQDPRVRYIVNTHGHYDHAAANRDLGPDAIVVAHPAAAEAMSRESDFLPGFPIPASPMEAQPDVLTETSLRIPFNGEQVHVIAVPAHTEGDVVVWFEKSRVLHMGDNYFGETTKRLYPGKSPAHYYDAMQRLLATVPDDAIVISGHASRVSAAKLKAAFAASHAIFVFVQTATVAGKDDASIIREGETAGHPRPWIEHFLETRRK